MHSEQVLKPRLSNPVPRRPNGHRLSFTLMHLEATAREDFIKAGRLIRRAERTRQRVLLSLGLSRTSKLVFDQTNPAGQFVSVSLVLKVLWLLLGVFLGERPHPSMKGRVFQVL